MKKAIALAVWSLLAILAAQIPAEARRLPDRQEAAQLKKGLAAFDRYDYTAAGVLLQLPAKHGNANAQAVLCFLHTYGRGVPQIFHEAAMWCHRSADQGNAQAQYMLGLLYDKGHGVPENYVQAYKWLELAAVHAIAMLRSDGGTSIAALMEAMGWQQHSVRGFLAGVVRKRLGLKLESNKVDGSRILSHHGHPQR